MSFRCPACGKVTALGPTDAGAAGPAEPKTPLEELASGDGARVVPGVGEVTGAECIRWMTDYIREMHDSVSELHASGASLEDTLKTVKMKKYNSWAGHRQRLSNNLTAAYRSLSARAARAARPAAGKE